MMLIPVLHKVVRWHLQHQGVQSKNADLSMSSTHYYEAGPDVPTTATLVLVHGLGTSASSWVNVLPLLAARWHVLAPDLPGFGFSRLKKRPADLRVKHYEDCFVEWIDRIAPKHFILIGHSFGGWITMRCAVNNPARISRLILVNTAGIYYPGTEQQRVLFDLKSPKETMFLLDHIWTRYPWYFRPFMPWIHEDLIRRRVPEVVASIEREDFMNARLSRLKMPVDVIWGMNDRLISHESLNILEGAIPGLQAHRIERCGHVPQLERPGELMEILESILGGKEEKERG